MLLFVVSMTALTSCKKVDTNLLVGNWECVSASYIDDNVQQPLPSYIIGMVWEFKTDGTIVGNVFDPTDGDDYGTSATYVVSGNLLTIRYRDLDGDLDTETFLINELTNSKLVLRERDDDDLLLLEFKKV